MLKPIDEFLILVKDSKLFDSKKFNDQSGHDTFQNRKREWKKHLTSSNNEYSIFLPGQLNSSL